MAPSSLTYPQVFGVLWSSFSMGVPVKPKSAAPDTEIAYLTQAVATGDVNGDGKADLVWRDDNGKPGELVKSIAPLFNRAVLFDTTNAWHGLPEPITCPQGQYRKSLAVYYLCDPREGAAARNRALFAPTQAQAGDAAVMELIERRAR